MVDFSVVMPVKNEADLLPYSLPNVYALKPDEVILVMEPNSECINIAHHISARFRDHVRTEIFVLSERTEDWKLRHAWARRTGFLKARNNVVMTVDVDKVVDPHVKDYFHLLDTEGVGLVSFSELPYPFSYRWYMAAALQKLGYPYGFMGLYVFKREAWLETEDQETVKQITCSEDTHLVECMKRKYHVKHVSSVKNINIRPYESARYQFLIGVERKRHGTPFPKVLLSSLLFLRPLSLKGYLNGLENAEQDSRSQKADRLGDGQKRRNAW